MPRILLYDLEISPNIGYTWGKWNQNVIDFQQEWYVLCVAWKWLGESKLYYSGINSFSKPNFHDDKNVVKVIHDLFDEADITIAHNGDRFDKRKANARFLYHGLTPPSPYQTIDTLKHARKHFSFNSNKLTDLGKLLGLGVKVPTGGFDLWKGCMAGDEASWKRMERYSKQDVRLLEKVYKKMLPWIDNHPNLALYSDGSVVVCPNCGQESLTRRGFSYTKTQVYQRYECRNPDCGKWSRDVRSVKERKAIIT